jgi:hypothetical protein
MNQNELEKRLILEGVDPRAYSLYGADYNECLVLSQMGNDTWQIYYSERGLITALNEFQSETEACETFLQMLLDDPTTRPGEIK